MRDASPAQQMEFQKLIGDAKMFSDLSQNHREALEQRGMEIMKNPEQYRPEAIDYYRNQFASDNAGNFELDDSQFKQKFDYYGHVIKNLLPAAKSEADAAQTPYSEKFSLDQAKRMIANDISSNPAAADEAIYQFNKAEDKLGARTASEYMQNKYANDLVVNIRKAGPQASVPGDSKKGKVLLDWTTREDGTKYATISVGGRKPTPVTVEDPNNPGYSVTYQPMEYIQRKGADGKNEIVLKATNAKTNKIEYLDYNTAQNTLFHGYQIENPVAMMDNPESTGAKTKGYDLSKPKMSESEWNTSWGKLKKGQSMVGLDGKTYIKK